ncbi:MAG: SRPBCC family protein [Prevotella sp.]|uniref:SRPBCC family protein n=1 Tax=Prevotella sp. TaxID=59823 RepID=UPI002A2CF29A|nr:SRPBCC family protein [Prevotella sp.]MDD7317318.1 SRPBCC family protein [Prevotellaceae bacterium]MDY4019922.1 SRPBCC family protein [Prevotella sp.]
MSKFESKIKQVPYPRKNVFDMLSDLNNIERVRNRIPEDKIKDLSFDSDSVSISSPLGPVTLRVVERDEPKCVKFETEKSPVPMNLWIQMLPTSDTESKLKVTISAELPFFMAAMAKKPLEEAVEKIAEALSMIPYDTANP